MFPDDNCQTHDGKGLMLHTTSTVSLLYLLKCVHNAFSGTCIYPGVTQYYMGIQYKDRLAQ